MYGTRPRRKRSRFLVVFGMVGVMAVPLPAYRPQRQCRSGAGITVSPSHRRQSDSRRTVLPRPLHLTQQCRDGGHDQT